MRTARHPTIENTLAGGQRCRAMARNGPPGWRLVAGQGASLRVRCARLKGI